MFSSTSPGMSSLSCLTASWGQAVWHTPQRMHVFRFISAFSSTSLIASTGHASMHIPHPMQSSFFTQGNIILPRKSITVLHINSVPPWDAGIDGCVYSVSVRIICRVSLCVPSSTVFSTFSSLKPDFLKRCIAPRFDESTFRWIL